MCIMQGIELAMHFCIAVQKDAQLGIAVQTIAQIAII